MFIFAYVFVFKKCQWSCCGEKSWRKPRLRRCPTDKKRVRDLCVRWSFLGGVVCVMCKSGNLQVSLYSPVDYQIADLVCSLSGDCRIVKVPPSRTVKLRFAQTPVLPCANRNNAAGNAGIVQQMLFYSDTSLPFVGLNDRLAFTKADIEVCDLFV